MWSVVRCPSLSVGYDHSRSRWGIQGEDYDNAAGKVESAFGVTAIS